MVSIQESLLNQKVVHCDSEIMSGVPVFVGTRVPLQTFFDYLEGDSGLSEFLEDFPHLQDKVFLTLETITRAVLEEERMMHARSA